MDCIAMRDSLRDATDKLAVLSNMFATRDADLNSCHDGLALFTEGIFDDVEEVLEALEAEAKADSTTA